ncbi:hypothetical protein [Trinickia mobilis]|uniref:hypothetical protein n=1 Tax=Trinickia mobilis TaxID=2816356 RepID=UPI001A8DFAC7|nr:hypothetical protein [Trinickia mobilis]
MERSAFSESIGEGTLPELWQRRTCLSHDEMVSIYTLVHHALMSYHPFELQALSEDKEELISQFICCKVLRLETIRSHGERFPLHSAPSSGRAVCAYFRRYLIDCLRSASHQRNVSFDDRNQTIEFDQPTVLDGDPVESVLLEHGLDEVTVRNAAAQFIAELDEADALLLAGSLGWLSDEKGGLSEIAERYGIASYHYRARKLGLTLKKGSVATDFAHTRIGQWIEHTLGIEIAAENRMAILMVLGVLAEQSRRPD